ncbi:hypothetical protein K501DRAFT_336948 [Backusella circina FSU 941]|nr:hypothetical protein K501DRAFT_336948 [Backusella circina FSU 941]
MSGKKQLSEPQRDHYSNNRGQKDRLCSNLTNTNDRTATPPSVTALTLRFIPIVTILTFLRQCATQRIEPSSTVIPTRGRVGIPKIAQVHFICIINTQISYHIYLIAHDNVTIYCRVICSSTQGTLDSALYVTRFTNDLKKPLTCALARTDARNSLSQEVLELDTPIIMVGGANGLLEFFLCKGPLDKEPQLEFLKTEIPPLPSNLPILTLKSIKTENDYLITVRQDYQKVPKRPNVSQKASFSVIKFDKETCKEIVSNMTHLGTSFSTLSTDSAPYQLWSCYAPGNNNNAEDFEPTIQVWSLLDDATWKFELVSTHFLKQVSTVHPLKVHLTGPTSCWVLSKGRLIFIDEIDEKRGQKRRRSVDSQSEPASKIKTSIS